MKPKIRLNRPTAMIRTRNTARQMMTIGIVLPRTGGSWLGPPTPVSAGGVSPGVTLPPLSSPVVSLGSGFCGSNAKSSESLLGMKGEYPIPPMPTSVSGYRSGNGHRMTPGAPLRGKRASGVSDEVDGRAASPDRELGR